MQHADSIVHADAEETKQRREQARAQPVRRAALCFYVLERALRASARGFVCLLSGVGRQKCPVR